ncbi:MAG: choice-of-anchor V domain-containing protein [Myxococcaceae bacterium]
MRLFGSIVSMVALGFAPQALAHSAGIASTSFAGTGCNLCHSGGTAPTVVLTGPASMSAGVASTFRLTVSTANGLEGGLNLRSSVSGTFAALSTLPGASVRTITGANGWPEATHSSPKPDADDGATDGKVTFEVSWTPPAGASGSITFTAWGLSASGAGGSNGDLAAMASLVVPAGSCVPVTQPVACAGKDCGPVGDGCGGMYSCGGTCAGGRATCGGGGTPGVCGCPPASVIPESCNGIDDDCNGLVDDGSNVCPGVLQCVASTCSLPDGGFPDAGRTDAGIDAGTPDAGGPDGGGGDAGSADAGSIDAGNHDAGAEDAGSGGDCGLADAGGEADGGVDGPGVGGCGCGSSAQGTALGVFLGLVLMGAHLARRRRPSR